MSNILRKIIRFFFFIIPPLSAVILAIPLSGLLEIPPRLLFFGSSKHLLATSLIIAPFYLGILAAPGYVYIFYAQPKAVRVSKLKRYWLRTSMALAFLSSLGGIVGGYWMILFLPPSLLSAIAVVRLWCLFDQMGTTC